MDPTLPVVKKPFNSKPFIFLLGIIIVAVLIVAGSFYIQKQGLLNTQKVSPYILQITSPIHNISGKIEKISNNTVTIIYTTENPMLPPLPLIPEASPTPSPKPLPFQVLVTDKTIINTLSINPIAATPSAQPNPNLTINDLTAGQIISVTAKEDLRILQENQFEAVYIFIFPEVTFPKTPHPDSSSVIPLLPPKLPPLPASNSAQP